MAGWVVIGTASLAACERKNKQLDDMGISEERAKEILEKIDDEKKHGGAPSSVPKAKPQQEGLAERPSASVGVPPPAEQQDTDPDLQSARFIVDGLVDVAPAGPSSAHERGVYVVTEDQQLLLAPLGAPHRGSEPGPSAITEIPSEAGPFDIARGPSFSDQHAYWISQRTLYRHSLSPNAQPGTALVRDARVATRVSAASLGVGKEAVELVSYIALPQVEGGPLVARLVAGETVVTLTDEGSAALSVQLVAAKDHAMVYSLEGRTGMSILHARKVSLEGGKPVLGSDEVIWVGGGATPTTELRLAQDDKDDVFGLLPIEQDTTHFGMAVLALTRASVAEPANIEWAPYPNGMDYSPTSGDVVCGQLTAIFARPSAAAPQSPQELVLARIVEGKPEPELVLGRSRVFYDASIAAIPGGALISYVSDRRTWGRVVRCKQS